MHGWGDETPRTLTAQRAQRAQSLELRHETRGADCGGGFSEREEKAYVYRMRNGVGHTISAGWFA
jgi:hypothetical protein